MTFTILEPTRNFEQYADRLPLTVNYVKSIHYRALVPGNFNFSQLLKFLEFRSSVTTTTTTSELNSNLLSIIRGADPWDIFENKAKNVKIKVSVFKNMLIILIHLYS